MSDETEDSLARACDAKAERIVELEKRVARLKASGVLLDELNAAHKRIAELENEALEKLEKANDE